MADPRAPRVLVLGLGNLLMQDDGVGVHAAHALANDPPPGSLVADVGTAVLDALPLLEQAEFASAIDAVDAGKPPGTLVRLPADAAALPDRTGTLHELDLPAALRLLPARTRPPVVVVGMQPAIVAVGMELSAAVAEALPRLCHAVRRIVRHYLDRHTATAAGRKPVVRHLRNQRSLGRS